MFKSNILKITIINTQKLSSRLTVARRNFSSQIEAKATPTMNYKTLKVTEPQNFVFHVELNRPDKLNAFNNDMWLEIKSCFDSLNDSPDCRAVVLSAAGKHFSAGIDLQLIMSLGQIVGELEDAGRKSVTLEKLIKLYQDSLTSLELCAKPIISVTHSACVGAGLNLIAASDIRYCTEDAWFQAKEVKIGMIADVGVLQRLPKIIGNQSLARELCLTGRKFLSDEALQHGLVSKVFKSKDTAVISAIATASSIAANSPLAVQGTKKNLVYSLDHTNQEGLDQAREINKVLLQSQDVIAAVTAQMNKETPVFSKL